MIPMPPPMALFHSRRRRCGISSSQSELEISVKGLAHGGFGITLGWHPACPKKMQMSSVIRH